MSSVAEQQLARSAHSALNVADQLSEQSGQGAAQSCPDLSEFPALFAPVLFEGGTEETGVTARRKPDQGVTEGETRGDRPWMAT